MRYIKLEKIYVKKYYEKESSLYIGVDKFKNSSHVK